MMGIQVIFVDEIQHGIGGHGCGVFAGIGDGHSRQAQAFVEFVVVEVARLGQVCDGQVKLRDVGGKIINANGRLLLRKLAHAENWLRFAFFIE